MIRNDLVNLMEKPRWKKLQSFHNEMLEKHGEHWLDMYKKTLSKETYDAYYSALTVIDIAASTRGNIPEILGKRALVDYKRDYAEARR